MSFLPHPTQDDRASTRVGELMRGFSLEATLPGRAEVAALRDVLAPGTAVYLSSPPNHSPLRLIEAAGFVHDAGLAPVPHIAARAFASLEQLDAFVAALRDRAEVSRALVIAGDREQPAGPFADALALIRSDVLQRHGMTEIGIAAYPDGHPKIGDGALMSALNEKLEAAYMRGLTVHIVTQFCFDAAQILAWLRRIRYARIDAPVRIGIAGPTSLRGLVRYALRCGVRASLKGMMNPKAAQILAPVAPDELVHTLAEAKSQLHLEPVGVHFFSFGGVRETARWAVAVAIGSAP